MAELNQYPGQLIFGLDIGTRSIVGTVGYKENDRFYIAAQRSKEHETRAMIDGQIHDIGSVGNTILEVKKELELVLNRQLEDVCIAAAGRVLRTVTTHVTYDLDGEREVTAEDVYTLNSMGMEQAYGEFVEVNDTEMKFYCVGYSVVHYYMNDYPISNLENHNARVIAADLIATFLPDDVVDGLYKAVEKAGLKVVNLTLEPIAAIQVAIPEMYRMLNIALVDVGAGTSDISITKDGSIIAYGMIPKAGDGLTELIAQHCLVDFVTADNIKRQAYAQDVIEYKDIMGLPQTITKEELLEVMEPAIDAMTKEVSAKIKELNGEKAVSAVFVVGGGGKIPTYTERLSQELGIQKERVALRGEEVMQKIEFLEAGQQKDSLLVTPIGICLTYYDQSNNFIFVHFNDNRIKLFDNGHLAIVDAAMHAGFPHEGLFPRRGRELNFKVNGKSRIVRGEPGEAAEILLNGEHADIHTSIKANDIISVKKSTIGTRANMEIGRLPEYHATIEVFVNEQKVLLPKFASVNGELQSEFYDIRDNDDIEILNYYTVRQILEFMDVILEKNTFIYVNNKVAQMDTLVYENFSMTWTLEKLEPALDDIPKRDEMKDYSSVESFSQLPEEEDVTKDAALAGSKNEHIHGNGEEGISGQETQEPGEVHSITIALNNSPLTLSGKRKYLFVDIFDFFEFDLSKPQGKTLITTHNGKQAQYMETLYDGDVVEIYWKN